MPIYAKSTAELMRQYVAEHPDREQFTADEIIAWFKAHWPKIKPSTVQAHLTKMSTNVPSRVHLGVKPDHDLFFRLSPGRFRRYHPDSDPPPIYRGSPQAPLADDADTTDDEAIASQQGEIFA